MDTSMLRFMVSGTDIEGADVQGFLVFSDKVWLVVEPNCLFKYSGHHVVNLNDVSPVIQPPITRRVSQPPDLLGSIIYTCPVCGSNKVQPHKFCEDCGNRLSK